MINQLKKSPFLGNISLNTPLGLKTAFKTGGNADYFIEPKDFKSLKIFLEIALQNSQEFIVIGGGTNTLIKDSGIKYAVSIVKTFNGFKIEKEDKNNIYLRVKSGTKLQKLCWHCAKRGFKGLNCLIGIPGSFGGALKMNAGTNKGSIDKVLQSITIVSKDLKKKVLSKKDITTGYRSLKIEDKTIDNFIILDALIKLEKTDSANLYIEARQLLRERKISQPVKANSAGCFFKNPSDKIPAGLLIDKAGLKGKTIGGAAISKVHANFITNNGNATASDILALKEIIQDEIKQKYDVFLEAEVKIVGR